MTTFFVVHVLDVNYAAITSRVTATVTATNGNLIPMVPTTTPGELKAALPDGTTSFEASVTAESTSFWPMKQKLLLQPGGTLPTITFDGDQAINARSVAAHQDGVNANVVLDVVLGHLKDAQSKVAAVAAGTAAASLSPLKTSLRDLEQAILDSKGSGWNRLHHAVKKDQLADGKMFFVERPTVPKLVAIYKPPHMFVRFQKEGQDPVGVPIPYHAFFHPSTSKFKDDYPFGAQYIDLIARYVLFPPIFSIGKSMANQHFISGKRAVFVFPVGSPTLSFANIPRQADLFRLFQEINYWLQRMEGISRPLNPVGRCAVSAFSAGCAALRQTLQNPFAEFDNNHFREVYGFDLYEPDDIPAVCSELKTWFRKAKDDRRLRIYTQNLTWFNNLRALLAGPAVTTGPSNAMEEDTPSSTLLFNPKGSFWRDMAGEVTPEPPLDTFESVPSAITSRDRAAIAAQPTPQLRQKLTSDIEINKYYEVHQVHPALYMSHALKLSKFADP